MSAEFFSLALEDKEKYARVGTSDIDGYVHLEKESYVTYSHLFSTLLSCILLFDRVDPSIPGDLKEIFDICSLLSALSENLI